MNLPARVRRLESRVPPLARTDIPCEPEAFLRGFLAGDFTPDEIDRRNPDHIACLTMVLAAIGARRGEEGPAGVGSGT